MRLVSLLPAATEIVYALGLGDHLVGVTFECDEPAAARRDKVIVVGGRDTTGMTPREIDDYVHAQVDAGADLYTLHAGALAELAPDVILTQDLCRVCALPAGRIADALDFLGSCAKVVSLDPHTLDEVLDSILTVGAATGAAARAGSLVAALRNRLSDIELMLVGRPRPRVAVVEWTDPPFSAGHWVPDLVTAAGGLPVGAVPGGRSAQTTFAQLRAEAPDVVLVAPCGYDLAGAVAQAREVAREFPGLPVWAIDANGLIVRPGPRLVDGVETIAAALHADVAAPARPHRLDRVA